ncbi:MAG: RagB/SusD family nutrient uptake outer membrane protein [Dysgonamonadaceae bacterium]|nr:RagB/SusD family nutrient uptake outer membrane protein [Dysgonamonadaceae bacterium]
MKNIFRIITGCIAIFCALALPSCSDLLNQEPQGQWTAEDNKGGSFASDVFTLYAKARGYHVTTGNTAFAIHIFRSEDAEKGSTASDGSAYATQFDDFNYSPSMSSIGTYWTENYAIVHIANNILAAIAEANEASLTEGDLINKGEAYFFRAFVYFNLVRAFGEVPLIDFPIKDAVEANVPKSSVEQIYSLIDSDLTEAEKYLPKTWGTQYPGRLTWGAAAALHAKTYLMRNDWANAFALASEVINSGIYNLNTPFSQVFREDGENCSESVWELQCTSTADLPASNTVGSQFAQVQGCRGAGDFNLGWGWNCPTQILADAFEAGDPRKDETLLYFYKTGEDPATCPANTPWGEKPCANADVTNKYYNKKAYTNPTLRTQFTKAGYWVNIRMIRYSEVLLIAAEAGNELGKTTEALDYLEQVRARARAGNNAILPRITDTDKSILRAAIKHERRIELAMEWDRFYDLVRWGDAQNVLAAAGKTYLPKHQYLPLPQTEVDKSNGVLIQNPNY